MPTITQQVIVFKDDQSQEHILQVNNPVAFSIPREGEKVFLSGTARLVTRVVHGLIQAAAGSSNYLQQVDIYLR